MTLAEFLNRYVSTGEFRGAEWYSSFCEKLERSSFVGGSYWPLVDEAVSSVFEDSRVCPKFLRVGSGAQWEIVCCIAAWRLKKKRE